MYKKKPFFIVFEGVEGCGKSYQSHKLKKKLQKDGLMKELRMRQHFEKPSLKRQRKHKESLRRSAKAKRLKFLREISSE